MTSRPVDDAGDARTMAHLRHLWDAADPMPAELPDRVLFALGNHDDVDLDFELLLLVSDAHRHVGVRAAQVTLDTMTFAGPSLTVMIRVSVHEGGRRRLDGWLAPVAPMRLTVHHPEGTAELPVDGLGRFVAEDVPSGLTRIVFTPIEATRSRSFVTPSFEV